MKRTSLGEPFVRSSLDCLGAKGSAGQPAPHCHWMEGREQGRARFPLAVGGPAGNNICRLSESKQMR